MLESLDFLRELNMCSVMLRLTLAMFFGGLIGLERAGSGGRQDFVRICWYAWARH